MRSFRRVALGHGLMCQFLRAGYCLVDELRISSFEDERAHTNVQSIVASGNLRLSVDVVQPVIEVRFALSRIDLAVSLLLLNEVLGKGGPLNARYALKL